MAFITNYLTYATANEAPYMFHVWGAYTCLAAAIGRKIWFVADDGYLYPHLYILYVGKAGNGKGEAMRKVKRVLAEFGDVACSGNVETPEGFVRYICGNPNVKPPIVSPVLKIVYGPTGTLLETTPITIFATEFINFISMNAAGWINFLNDIWDADLVYHYRTKGQGEDKVPGPSVSLLGALTVDVAADLQKQNIISTGLARRTIFQFGERMWDMPMAFREITPERLEARDTCVRELLQIANQAKGLIDNTPEAKEFYRDWYDANLKECPMRPLNVQSWYASKSDIVIKLAMLTAVSEGDTVIKPHHYIMVLNYLAETEKDLQTIFGGVGRNELAAISIQMFEFIRQQDNPVSVKNLKFRFFHVCKPPNDFNECITYLKESGQVHCALFTVNGVADEVLATPEVLAAWVQRTDAAKIVLTSTVALLSQSDVAAEVRQEVPHSEVPGGLSSSIPTGSAVVAETAPVAPQTAQE